MLMEGRQDDAEAPTECSRTGDLQGQWICEKMKCVEKMKKMENCSLQSSINGVL